MDDSFYHFQWFGKVIRLEHLCLSLFTGYQLMQTKPATFIVVY